MTESNGARGWRNRNRRGLGLFAALAIVGAPLVLSGTSSAEVADVQGSAFGYWSDNISLFDGAQADKGPTPTVTLAADASNSPQTATAPCGYVAYGPATLLTTDAISVSSTGSLGAGGVVTTTSSISNINKATVTDCNGVNLTSATGSEIFTADNVSGSANAGDAGLGGSTTVTGGIVDIHSNSFNCASLLTSCGGHTHTANDPLTPLDESLGQVSVPTNPPVNYALEGHVHLCNSGPGCTDYYVIVFNEQATDPDGSITVNPVHEYFGYDLVPDPSGAYVDGSGNRYAILELPAYSAGGPVLHGHLYLGQVTCGATVVVPPQLSIADTSVTEGDAGTTVMSFTVTRSGDTSGSSSFNWSTATGSAFAPEDYVAVADAPVTFAPGETTKTLSVTVYGDTAVEPNEGFSVLLSSPTGATIADGAAVGRINNDDTAAFSVNDATVVEGDLGTTLATFTITRSGATAGPASVRWFTANGTASAPGDFTAALATTVNFAAGELTKTVSVSVNGDTAVEANETFVVRLTAAVGGSIADGTGQGRITNDDSATLAVNDVTLAEGESGTTLATFTITRSGATAGPASVQWSTGNGTASAPGDYTAVAPTTVNFLAGETSKTVSVTVNGDTAVEANETFGVRLSAPVWASIADGSGLGRITNDDTATLAVNDVTVTEGQSGTTLATFTIARTGATAGPASVRWHTANGTAGAPGDYIAVAPTTVDFAPGETSKTVSVSVNGDTAIEANETFQLRLTAPVWATIADGSGLGRITNDD